MWFLNDLDNLTKVLRYFSDMKIYDFFSIYNPTLHEFDACLRDTSVFSCWRWRRLKDNVSSFAKRRCGNSFICCQTRGLIKLGKSFWDFVWPLYFGSSRKGFVLWLAFVRPSKASSYFWALLSGGRLLKSLETCQNSSSGGHMLITTHCVDKERSRSYSCTHIFKVGDMGLCFSSVDK